MKDKPLELAAAIVLAVAAAILSAAAGVAFYVLDLYNTGGEPVVVASGEAAPNYWLAALLVLILPLSIGIVVFLSVSKREPPTKEARYNWR